MAYLTHELKILPEYFQAVTIGVKKARSCIVLIQHIADVSEYAPGFVLLSIDLPSMRCFPVVRPGGCPK